MFACYISVDFRSRLRFPRTRWASSSLSLLRGLT